MSNPTTPFSWQMPTATDLVTDLPADFAVFGQAVATSMQYLLGGTTGQILSKTSNTDMAFTWINNDQGDITGVTATSPLTGGGTSGAITVGIQDASTTQKGAVQLSDSTSTTSSILASTPTATKSAYDLANAAIPKSTVTTNGDIIYGTGSGTVTRLGIGSSNQVLKVTGGVPVWGSSPPGNITETVFNASNASWTIPTGVTTIWALCVGSGGGGGASSTATAQNGGGGGGAGQALEKVFTIVGDTTLNITVPAGGAGGTAGGKGSNGSAATIVGNTSATTYVTAAGGGGGGGGAGANNTGNAGASSGGDGASSSTSSGGGGGMGSAATDQTKGLLNTLATGVGQGNSSATTVGVTGYDGGKSAGNNAGGQGINIWGRSICGGGIGGSLTTGQIAKNFGASDATGNTTAGGSATANTGAGGNGAKTSATTALAGGNGGSGLVVLRYIS